MAFSRRQFKLAEMVNPFSSPPTWVLITEYMYVTLFEQVKSPSYNLITSLQFHYPRLITDIGKWSVVSTVSESG